MAFGIKYRVEFKDRKAIDWKVDILEDGYVGSVTNLKAWSFSPLKMKFRAASVKQKHSPIATKSIELLVASELDYGLLEFAYGSSKQYIAKVYKGAAQVFEGYVLKGLGDESYTCPPYPVKIVATDFINSLKNIPYERIFESNDIVKCSDVLLQIINVGIGISKGILDNSELFNNQDSPTANDVATNNTSVNQRVFLVKEMSYYDVLKNLMTTHYCRFMQHNGTGSTDCFWMVDNLEKHKNGVDITYKLRLGTDYSYVSDLIVSQPSLLHTDITPLSTPKISFIEAARNINVESEIVEPSNIMTEKGIEAFPGASIVNWTEIGGGKMASLSDANDYPSLNSYQFVPYKGVKHLGIGRGQTGSLYASTISGLTHDITIISSVGSGIFQLTFNNEFASPPSWTTAAGGKLYIENRGLFEITTAAAGGSGTSTIRIRVNKTSMTPRVGDRIIGNIDTCKVLEQVVGLEFLGASKRFIKNENTILELELTYANRWYDVPILNESKDEALNFIGIKAGDASGDTFNGEVWENLADNTSTNSFSQIIQFPETRHEQFETFKIEIPLTWDLSLSNSEFLTIALINGYSKGLLYKSINLKVKDVDGYVYNIVNDSDNDTDINVVSPLLKISENFDNSEYGSIGGIVTPVGEEVQLFGLSAPKIKNIYIGDQLKLENSENAQLWKGSVDDILFGNEIIQDTKNFSRNFQIQESVIDANQNTTLVSAVEIRPVGLGVEIYLIEIDEFEAFFDPHLAASTSTFDIVISNNGNTSIIVGGASSGAHFTISANQTIPAYEGRVFTITSTADAVDNYTETISFIDTLSNTNTVTIKCSVSVIEEATAPFNFKLLTHFPIVLAERYDFDEPQVTSTLINVNNIGSTQLDIEVSGTATTFKTSPETRIINVGETGVFDGYNDGGEEEGLFSGSYQFFDSNTDNFIDSDVEINVITGLRIWQPVPIGLNENRLRINGGDWINILVGQNNYINFTEGDSIDWEIEVITGDLEDIQMGVHFHGVQGTLTTWVGTAADSSNILTFDPFALAGDSVSLDLSVLDIS